MSYNGKRSFVKDPPTYQHTHLPTYPPTQLRTDPVIEMLDAFKIGLKNNTFQNLKFHIFLYLIIRKFNNSKFSIPLKVLTTIFEFAGSRPFERDPIRWVYFNIWVFRGHFYIVRKIVTNPYFASCDSLRFFHTCSRGAKVWYEPWMESIRISMTPK